MNFLNKIIISIIPFLPKIIVRFFSKKYVAGTDNNDALNVVKILNKFFKYQIIDTVL